MLASLHSHIIIIGAGASGLMAACELLLAGKNIRILEARNRIGGRIHTIYDAAFSKQVEMGAEFVHGDLPITLGLLKEFKLPYQKLQGRMWHTEQGEIVAPPEFIPGAEVLDKALEELQEDMSVQEFLEKYLGAEDHRPLYRDVQRFVEGYDAADISRASALAFKEEWNAPDSEHQHRPVNGYAPLMGSLANACMGLGADMVLSAVVKNIRWQPGNVEVTTANGNIYTADMVLVTVPLGVLQCKPGDEAFIDFDPPIPQHLEAAAELGYGTVVKINLQFSDAFWNHSPHEKLHHNMGFIFSDKGIPTWWTQEVGDVPMLTGWIGGPHAKAMKGAPDNILIDQAMETLSGIFGENADRLQSMLVAQHISRWTEDPFALGAYSYSVVHGEVHKQILSSPIENTIFFAGEALADGGTVEAAFASGKSMAKLMSF